MKNNTKNILISYENFNADSFINELMNSLTVNTSYSLLVKFGFEGNKLFYMSGPQIGIVLRDSHDINYYNNIFQIIEDRLEDIIVNYSLKSYPNNISLIIRVLTPLPDLIKNVKSLSLNKNLFQFSNTNKKMSRCSLIKEKTLAFCSFSATMNLEV